MLYFESNNRKKQKRKMNGKKKTFNKKNIVIFKLLPASTKVLE